jgi:alpha-ketoglutarate-dependent 2,4-dichlorophenoxyacetate dioxygenase
MVLAFKPLHPLFGAEMSGIDLRDPIGRDTIAEIDAAMDRHAVLLIRDQPLTPEQQLAFTRRFGPLDIGFARVAAKRQGSTRGAPGYMANMTNIAPDGKVVARDNGRILGNIANQLWHSDSSFQAPPARYSMLYSVTNPSWGGETEFADMRAAYDSLDARTRAEVEGLVAEHWALHSRFMLGDSDYTQEAIDAIPPVEWPIVRTHPGSGRKLLFIGVHARSVVGMTVPEGRKLLMDLLEHATQPVHVYRHEWRVGDLVIWDNRATLHRGRRFDLSEPRQLRRTTTLDAAEPLDQVA